MKWIQWAGVVMVSGITVMAGCQTKAPPQQARVYPPPVQVSPEARQLIARLAPDAAIGTVVAVIPESRLAAVADMPLSQVKIGDAVSFMGGEVDPVDVGVVAAIVNGRLHVRYDEPGTGGRPPAVGDLAIRFKK